MIISIDIQFNNIEKINERQLNRNIHEAFEVSSKQHDGSENVYCFKIMVFICYIGFKGNHSLNRP